MKLIRRKTVIISRQEAFAYAAKIFSRLYEKAIPDKHYDLGFCQILHDMHESGIISYDLYITCLNTLRYTFGVFEHSYHEYRYGYRYGYWWESDIKVTYEGSTKEGIGERILAATILSEMTDEEISLAP